MGQALSLLADWANGIFAVLLASLITGVEVQWWHLLVGIGLSHLPDIDALPELLRRGRVAASAAHPHDHRTFLHYPIVAVVVALIAISVAGYWGWVLALAMMLHLVNDLYGTGWGVALFWPWSGRTYKIFGRRVNRLKYVLQSEQDWQRIPVAERRLRWVVSWSSAELPRYITRWGVEEWIPVWYYRLNWVSGIEYTLFITACIAAALVLWW